MTLDLKLIAADIAHLLSGAHDLDVDSADVLKGLVRFLETAAPGCVLDGRGPEIVDYKSPEGVAAVLQAVNRTMAKLPVIDPIQVFTLEVDQDPTQDVFADALGAAAHGDLIPEGGPYGRQLIHASMRRDTMAEAISDAVGCVRALGLDVIGVTAPDAHAQLVDLLTTTAANWNEVAKLPEATDEEYFEVAGEMFTALVSSGWTPPIECDGSGTCSAPVHIQGCYRSAPEDDWPEGAIIDEMAHLIKGARKEGVAKHETPGPSDRVAAEMWGRLSQGLPIPLSVNQDGRTESGDEVGQIFPLGLWEGLHADFTPEESAKHLASMIAAARKPFTIPFVDPDNAITQVGDVEAFGKSRDAEGDES